MSEEIEEKAVIENEEKLKARRLLAELLQLPFTSERFKKNILKALEILAE